MKKENNISVRYVLHAGLVVVMALAGASTCFAGNPKDSASEASDESKSSSPAAGAVGPAAGDEAAAGDVAADEQAADQTKKGKVLRKKLGGREIVKIRHKDYVVLPSSTIVDSKDNPTTLKTGDRVKVNADAIFNKAQVPYIHGKITVLS